MKATDRAALTRLAGYPAQAIIQCNALLNNGVTDPQINAIMHMASADQNGDMQTLHMSLSRLNSKGFRNARTCAFMARCAPDFASTRTAAQLLLEAKALAGNDPYLLAEVAAAYTGINQHREALPILVKANSIIKDSGTLASMLAICQTHMGEYGAALLTARRSWSANPNTYHAAKALLPPALAERSERDTQLCLDWMQQQSKSIAASIITEWSDMLEHMRHFMSAAIVYRPLMEANTNSFEHVWRYGELLLKAYQPEDAELHLQKAADLQPDEGGIYATLGRCYIQLGDLTKAKRCLLKSIELSPKQVNAYAMLSEIDASAITERQTKDLAKAINNTSMDPEIRASGILTLARSQEAKKNYPGAFQYFSKANALLENHYHSLGNGYDKALVEEELAMSQEIFNDDNMVNCQLGQASSKEYVFILGMPRSGTTLCEQILSAHPQITGMGERGIIGNFWRLLTQEWRSGTDIQDFLESNLKGWAQIYDRAMADASTAASVYIDKAPLNFRYIGLIALMIPNAKIIYARRDPIDTCLSIFRLRFPHSFTFANNLDHLAHYYRFHLETMDYWRRVTSLETTEYQYEQLVENTETEAKRLVAFTGQQWDPVCLDFHTTGRPVYTLSGSQVRKPIYLSAVKRWREYETLLPSSVLALGNCSLHHGTVPTA